MSGPASAMATDVDDGYLDIIGQGPGLNIYTQICCCFSMADNSSQLQSAIINTLSRGLERLSTSFPWVAGQVVNEGSSEGDSGVNKIQPLEKTPRLVVKDLTNDQPSMTMEALKKASFPFSMLDENTICPRNTIPKPSDPPDSNPVFLVQANFITGGLIISLVGHHSAMDMTGQGQILDLLSKACRNELFTPDEISSGNLPRRNLIPLLDDSYDPRPEIAHHQIMKPSPPQPISPYGPIDCQPAPPSPPPPKCKWANIVFPHPSLLTLKSLATSTLPSNSSTPYVTTDDALTAFLWQRIARARLSRLTPTPLSTTTTTTTTTATTLTRAVDVRPYLSLPPTYPGLMQNLTYHTLPLLTLSSAPLGVLASHLRAAVSPKTSTLAHATRALATYLARTPDKSDVNITASLDLSKDLMISSWAKLNVYSLDFGLGLGTPVAVRRPRFVEVESLTYLLPRGGEGEGVVEGVGGCVVGVCLREGDWEGLSGDEEFARAGRIVE